MVGVEVRTMATPENQSLAGEKMAIRIDAEIKSCRVFSSSVMNVFKCLFADGKEFTFIISRSGGFCKPAYLRWPKQILFPGSQTFYIRFDFFVCLDRNTFSEIFIVTDRGIIVLSSPFSLSGLAC